MVKFEAELTEQDFADHPIWQYTDVEAGLVAPRPQRGAAPLMSLVSTKFVAADGTAYAGFGVTTKVYLLGLTLFSRGSHVPLHFGRRAPTHKDLQRSYALLGSSSSRLFPLRFSVVPAVKYKPIGNEVEFFSFQADDGSIQGVR